MLAGRNWLGFLIGVGHGLYLEGLWEKVKYTLELSFFIFLNLISIIYPSIYPSVYLFMIYFTYLFTHLSCTIIYMV